MVIVTAHGHIQKLLTETMYTKSQSYNSWKMHSQSAAMAMDVGLQRNPSDSNMNTNKADPNSTEEEEDGEEFIDEETPDIDTNNNISIRIHPAVDLEMVTAKPSENQNEANSAPIHSEISNIRSLAAVPPNQLKVNMMMNGHGHIQRVPLQFAVSADSSNINPMAITSDIRWKQQMIQLQRLSMYGQQSMPSPIPMVQPPPALNVLKPSDRAESHQSAQSSMTEDTEMTTTQLYEEGSTSIASSLDRNSSSSERDMFSVDMVLDEDAENDISQITTLTNKPSADAVGSRETSKRTVIVLSSSDRISGKGVIGLPIVIDEEMEDGDDHNAPSMQSEDE